MAPRKLIRHLRKTLLALVLLSAPAVTFAHATATTSCAKAPRQKQCRPATKKPVAKKVVHRKPVARRTAAAHPKAVKHPVHAKPVAERVHAHPVKMTRKQRRLAERQRPVKHVAMRRTVRHARVAERAAPAAHIETVAYEPRMDAPRAVVPEGPLAAPPRYISASLRSSVAYVEDLQTNTTLFSKNADDVRPIASISKLMMALVMLQAHLPMDQMLTVTDDDVDHIRYSASRLTVGTELTRTDLLHLALMSSENRAAHALARNYPGGVPAFVQAMNREAQLLGMTHTHFIEPTGLSDQNVSSPRDLIQLMRAASQQPLIRRYTTDNGVFEVKTADGRIKPYRNSDGLVRDSAWHVVLSKTGFINEAGECLVVIAEVGGRQLAFVLLNSQGKYSRTADAIRLRRYLTTEDVALR